MISMSDIVTVCQFAIRQQPTHIHHTIVLSIVFGMNAAGLIDRSQEDEFMRWIGIHKTVEEALNNMVLHGVQ